MYNSTSDFNNIANEQGRTTRAKITYLDQPGIYVTSDDILLNLSFNDSIVSDEGENYIGSFTAKSVKYEIDFLSLIPVVGIHRYLAMYTHEMLSNYTHSELKTLDVLPFNLASRNQRIKVEQGLMVNGEYEYVPMGEYVVVEEDKSYKRARATIEAYDCAIYFDDKYDLAWGGPWTLKEWAEAICNKVGVELGSVSWFNSDTLFTDEIVIDGTYRNAIQLIAQATLTFAKIGRDNKLYFKNFQPSGLLLTNIFEDDRGDIYGPVNQIAIKADIFQEDIIDRNQASVDRRGITEISIDNNEIINNQDIPTVIGFYLAEVDGIEYEIAKIEYSGNPAIDVGDILSYLDKEDNLRTLYVFNHDFEHTGGWYGTLEAVGMSKTITNATFVGDVDKKINRTTDAIVKRTEGEISLVVTKVEDIESDISDIDTDVGNLQTQTGSLELRFDELNIEFTETPRERRNKFVYDRNDIHVFGALDGVTQNTEVDMGNIPEVNYFCPNPGTSRYYYMDPAERRMYGLPVSIPHTLSGEAYSYTIPSTAYPLSTVTYQVWIYTNEFGSASKLTETNVFPGDQYNPASFTLTFTFPANTVGWYLVAEWDSTVPPGEWDYFFTHWTTNKLQLEEGSSATPFSYSTSTLRGALYNFTGDDATFYNAGFKIIKRDVEGGGEPDEILFSVDYMGDVDIQRLRVEELLNNQSAFSRVISNGRTLLVNSNGDFGTSASSLKYKENIESHTFDTESLLKLDIKKFNFIGEEDTEYGVIAEEADDLGLTELLGYNEEEPDYFHYERLPIALLQIVKEQDKKIKDLEERLSRLEGLNNA